MKLTDENGETPKQIEYPTLTPGHCSKCGAPYQMPTGPWMCIFPPTPIPTCVCWNLPTIKTTTTKGTGLV